MPTRRTDEFDRLDADSAEIPDRRTDGDLPPVQPPSAGFIVQLFLVPAIIVLVIVGLFLTFRTLVSGNQDWQSLVAELRSSNEHRRWRAHGLAQMLQADAARGESSERLARNPQIINELSALTKEQLARHSDQEADKKQLAFLTLALGYLESPSTVVPVLKSAFQPDQDREVRKNALAALAQVVDRSSKTGQSLDEMAIGPEVIKISYDADPLIRQSSAYVMGLFSGPDSLARLNVLVQDADANARLNAAVALARRKSPAGLEVFTAVLKEGDKVFDAVEMKRSDEQKVPIGQIRSLEDWQRTANGLQYEQLLGVSNSLKAVTQLAPALDKKQRDELRALIEPLAEEHQQPRIRLEAQNALNAIARAAQRE